MRTRRIHHARVFTIPSAQTANQPVTIGQNVGYENLGVELDGVWHDAGVYR